MSVQDRSYSFNREAMKCCCLYFSCWVLCSYMPNAPPTVGQTNGICEGQHCNDRRHVSEIHSSLRRPVVQPSQAASWPMTCSASHQTELSFMPHARDDGKDDDDETEDDKKSRPPSMFDGQQFLGQVVRPLFWFDCFRTLRRFQSKHVSVQHGE